MVMLAVRPPEPDPVPEVDEELLAAVEAAQEVLARFLKSKSCPVYVRDGVAQLMAYRRA